MAPSRKGVFQRFVPKLWKHLKSAYPFVRRLDIALGPALPKSSSFYLGTSPTYHKHVIVMLQPADQSWSVGEFAVNVYISTELAFTSIRHGYKDDYAAFNDGYYRLGGAVGDPDRWWCLQARDPDLVQREPSQYITYWRPSSYESEEEAFRQVAENVSSYLEDKVFRKAGFVP